MDRIIPAIGSNAIVALPQGRERFEAGELVDALLIGPLTGLEPARQEATGGG